MAKANKEENTFMRRRRLYFRYWHYKHLMRQKQDCDVRFRRSKPALSRRLSALSQSRSCALMADGWLLSC